MSLESARQKLVDLVTSEIAAEGGKAFEHRDAIAERIADMLIAQEDDGMALGLRGSGVWLRGLDTLPIDRFVANLDFGVMAITTTNTSAPANRSATAKEYARTAIKNGKPMWGMIWGPHPQYGFGHIEPALDFAAALGMAGVMVDGEPDFGWESDAQLGFVAEYGARLAEGCAARGMKSGYTNYGTHPATKRLYAAILEHVDGGFAQGYDPSGRYSTDYFPNVIEFWRSAGAKKLVMGVGAWLRSERRHRTPLEMQRHLELIPKASGICAVCAWYAGEGGITPLLPVLREYRPPGAKRSILSYLTPFGAALEDELGDC